MDSMDANDVRPGIAVRTTELSGTEGMVVAERHLTNRRAGATGNVTAPVPGHGGDVWWVRHGDNDVAAYCASEFEPDDALEPLRVERLA
jgi:hypothetical protein